MQELLKKSTYFIRDNPRIIYSLVLVVVIPIAIFFNTYFITSRFQKNIDSITRSKAILVENIIGLATNDVLQNPGALQAIINKISKENSSLEMIQIMTPHEDKESFIVIASSNENELGRVSQEIKNYLAWKQPEGIAFLNANDRGRFWNITKAILDETGNRTALISLSFSLADSDQLINSTINSSYLILALTILVILLLVSNQTRLFGYALALTKLKEIDKMKDTFVSMASHELRSPLTAMKGNLEFLEEKNEQALDPDSQHYLNNLKLSTNRLESLVNDILEVSRLEGNRIPIKISDIEPTPLIIQSIEEMKAQATQKGLTINYLPAEIPKIKADPDRLKQILINLIGNSIKYTPAGKIEVTTKFNNKELLITIADTGIGISAEDQKNLFQKFYRIQNEKTQKIIGTGLGLWITLDLARKMDGNITVESIEGVGSHFTLHMPLA